MKFEAFIETSRKILKISISSHKVQSTQLKKGFEKNLGE